MWDLIVSVPDNCLSFYFKIAHFCGWCQEKCVSQENRENDKIQLSPTVTPGVLNTYFLQICYSDAIIPNIFTFLDNITSKCI